MALEGIVCLVPRSFLTLKHAAQCWATYSIITSSHPAPCSLYGQLTVLLGRFRDSEKWIEQNDYNFELCKAASIKSTLTSQTASPSQDNCMVPCLEVSMMMLDAMLKHKDRITSILALCCIKAHSILIVLNWALHPNLFSWLHVGAPVRSTSYIDEPDSPSRDNYSASVSPGPSNHHSHGLGPPPQANAATARSQSYLNLIDDSASHDNHEENGHSTDEGSILFSTQGAAGSQGRDSELEVNRPSTSNSNGSIRLMVDDASEEKLLCNGHTKGRSRPPDIILGSMPSHDHLRSTIPCKTSSGLELRLQDDMHNMNCRGNMQDREEVKEATSGGLRVKHGHSRTWQRNVHCLETEV